jgi:imidazolonepropionase-like amidohydrolase
MRTTKITLCILGVLVVCTLGQRVSAQARRKSIVIAASTAFDGKGGVLHDTLIVIEGSKIVALDQKADPKAVRVDYDLRGLTVLPGWIDAHAHITWTSERTGKTREWLFPFDLVPPQVIAIPADSSPSTVRQTQRTMLRAILG